MAYSVTYNVSNKLQLRASAQNQLEEIELQKRLWYVFDTTNRNIVPRSCL